MKKQLKQWKDQLYYYFAVKNSNINKDYHIYKSAHSKERLKRLLQLARLNVRYRFFRRGELLYYKSDEEKASERVLYYRFPDARPSVDALLKKLSVYDVISFDIFDTAIYRKVDKPERIFYIMGMEMGFHDFMSVRKKAERCARDLKERQTGSREIVLSEIYDLLREHSGIDGRWMEREIELELSAICVNPYIYSLYQKLVERGKTIIFTSDMYLPKSVIEQMLKKAGYTTYEKLYLSNEYGENKGNGKLQQIVLNDYPDKKIVHIGDTENSDIKMSQKAGMDAIYHRDARPYLAEPNMDSLTGSTYNAVIKNTMNNGLWQDSLHYDHGYRIGGILVAGYCQYINKIAREHGIEKILFCARDCDIVQKVYNRYFYQFENEYLRISRYAILNLCAERYAYDLVSRCIMRYMTEFRSTKTIGTILTECGYGYLIPLLEENSLEQFMFPQNVNNSKIERFILEHVDVIRKHNSASIDAAMEYYSTLIGSAKRILIVDIGWTGSCITALKYFLEKHFPEKQLFIRGTLACTSRNWALTSSVEDGIIDGYLYTPFKNIDAARRLMPGGEESRNRDLMDRLHIPIESLFTSKEASLLAYQKKADGSIGFVRRAVAQPNEAEIDAIQAGMMDFTEQYLAYQKDLGINVEIPPYVAYSPYETMLKYDLYCCAVYRNFVYDTPMAPFDTTNAIITMESLYSQETVQNLSKLEKEAIVCKNCDAVSERKTLVRDKTQKSRLLFISPELIQTGAPRSLLRMCRVALTLGYEITLWSAKDGPFRTEYENLGIGVEIVPENRLKEERIQKEIASFNMAICNTIVTDAYVRVCSCVIPTVWYIREATNIPDFIMNNWERKHTLEKSRNIYCVSEYAAEAIKKYTDQDVKVVRNCVEDEIELATDYCAGSGEKVKFVQFGTMEYRKGYDVLLAAYKAMPAAYQGKAELYFAGGFINSGTPYCSYLFGEMQNEINVHYLGVVRGEKNKIQTLSEMDVIVVASRDESCSLVALEGAMLSKPLIVTENVGAKYMVDDSNGFIVKTADIGSLSQAMMKMIDQKSNLQTMGKASRVKYEQMANMESYTAAMEKLYAAAADKGSEESRKTIAYSKKVFSLVSMEAAKIAEQATEKRSIRTEEEVIVSMTSYPARINTILPCVESLLKQKSKPKKLLLWLAKPQFPNLEDDLPVELRELAKDYKHFEIRWTEDDLKPHKKYYYAMQEYPDLPVITVDDDVVYAPELVSRLMDSYRRFPDCISCMRTNMIMFNLDGSIRSYDGWMLDYSVLKDTPSAQLLPTGIGGVLYPPHALPDYAFDKDTISKTSLFADDLWLKVNTLHNGYKTVLVKNYTGYRQIEGTNETALWRQNVTRGNNDIAMANILAWYDVHIGSAKELLRTMRKDRAV